MLWLITSWYVIIFIEWEYQALNDTKTSFICYVLILELRFILNGS